MTNKRAAWPHLEDSVSFVNSPLMILQVLLILRLRVEVSLGLWILQVLLIRRLRDEVSLGLWILQVLLILGLKLRLVAR